MMKKKVLSLVIAMVFGTLTIIISGCATDRVDLVDAGVLGLEQHTTGKVYIAWSDAHKDGDGFVVTGVLRRRDIHLYPDPGVAPVEANRAIILGEFGGIGWNVKGHEWIESRGHGHSGIGDGHDLTNAYLQRIWALWPMIRLGLSAACYTQIADQEIECNGLMTYDREVLKLDAELTATETMKLYDTPPVIRPGPHGPCLAAIPDTLR